MARVDVAIRVVLSHYGERVLGLGDERALRRVEADRGGRRSERAVGGVRLFGLQLRPALAHRARKRRAALQERRESLLLVALVEQAAPEHRHELREDAHGAREDLRVGRVRVAVDQERDRAHACCDERSSCEHGAPPQTEPDFSRGRQERSRRPQPGVGADANVLTPPPTATRVRASAAIPAALARSSRAAWIVARRHLVWPAARYSPGWGLGGGSSQFPSGPGALRHTRRNVCTCWCSIVLCIRF